MATLLVDGLTVGPAPLPGPPTANPAIPSATWEFRPVANKLPDGEGGPNANYISTYQPFTLAVSAIPTAPLEVITSLTITLKSCVLEDPLPGSETTRSLDAPLKIKVSPFWAPGLFLEPLVVTTPGAGGVCTISGYFTERNWYDREIVVSYLNAVTRFTSDGFFYAPLENFPTNLPFDLKKINKKLRFYFDVVITSTLGTYPSTAYMIVQYNQKAANERLKFLLKRRRINAILNIEGDNFEEE